MATSQFVSSTAALQIMNTIMSEQDKLIAIHRQQINYVEQSNVDVNVDRSYNTVKIADVADPIGGFFLQSDEADEFINQADDLFEQDVFSMNDCYKIIAYSYIDALV
jgi:hypothetical protein